MGLTTEARKLRKGGTAKEKESQSKVEQQISGTREFKRGFPLMDLYCSGAMGLIETVPNLR